jgi:thymidylate synthase (FAD)
MVNVKLVSYTSSCISGIESLSDIIAYCARVSNPGNQTNTSTSERLIDYLIKHRHWSPLEMVNVCLEVETTRDIARQLLRHRSFTFQEFSMRYADPVKELDFSSPREARLQDTTNRQNSLVIDDPVLQQEWDAKQQHIIECAKEAYQWAVARGIAKEQARVVLPEGLIMSRLYVNGTLRSWLHYVELRSGPETQKEHRELALLCARELESIFPVRFISELKKNDSTDA